MEMFWISYPRDPVAVPDVLSEAEWTRYVLRRLSDGDYECARLTNTGDLIEHVIYSSLKDALTGCANENGGICVNARVLHEAFVETTDESEGGEEHRPAPQMQIACFLNRKSSQHYLRDGDDLASLGMSDGRAVADHNTDVEGYVIEIARKIGLNDELAATLGLAGFGHDHGKDRWWWQAAIDNPRSDDSDWKPLAKTMHKGFNSNLNNHYRHEFGSLVEAEARETLKIHPNRDLIMHLIAAHHGYGRPYFPENAFDRMQPSAVNYKIAHEAMQRFASLQRQYGWWQLAYIEAILKCADALASRDFARGKP